MLPEKVADLAASDWKLTPKEAPIDGNLRPIWIRIRFAPLSDSNLPEPPDQLYFFHRSLGAKKVVYFERKPGMMGWRKKNLNEPFYLNPNSEETFPILAESLFPLSSETRIGNRAAFESYASPLRTLMGAFLGSVLSLGVVNLVVYFLIRRKVYLRYCLYAFSSSFSLAIMAGFFQSESQAFFWEGSLPAFGVPKFVSGMVALFAVSFMSEFLKLSTELPRIYKAINAFLVLLFLTNVLNFFPWPNNSLFVIQQSLLFVSLLGTLLICIYCALKKTQSSLIFSLSWSVYIVSIVLWLGTENGGVPRNFFTTNGPVMGQMLESIILAAALVQDLRKQERLKVKAAEGEVVKTLLRTMTHDLASPIQVMQYHSEKLLKADSENRSVQRVQKAASLCIEILKTVRELQSLKDQKLKLKLEYAPLLPIVHDTVEHLSDHLLKKSVKIEIENENLALNAQVLIDKGSFKVQVLMNLLTNAIKFSRPDQKVKIFAEVAANRSDELWLHIQDFGVGIPNTIMKGLFEFTGLSNRPGTDGEKGTGYGMPIVKSFLESYGGTIRVVSRSEEYFPNGSGTTFTLVLRAREA